jgi:hypothetical protein
VEASSDDASTRRSRRLTMAACQERNLDFKADGAPRCPNRIRRRWHRLEKLFGGRVGRRGWVASKSENVRVRGERGRKGGEEPSESKKLLTLWKGIVGGPTNMNGGRYLGPFQTIFF